MGSAVTGSCCDRLRCTALRRIVLCRIAWACAGRHKSCRYYRLLFRNLQAPRLISSAAFRRRLPQHRRSLRSVSATFRRQLPKVYRVFRSFFAAAFRRWFSTDFAAIPPVFAGLRFLLSEGDSPSPSSQRHRASGDGFRRCFPSVGSGRPCRSPLRFPTFSALAFSPRATAGPFAGSFAAGPSSRAPPR